MTVIVKWIAIAVLFTNLSSLAKADDDIMVGDLVIRATVGSMNATGGYVAIMNHGAADDRLIAVAAPFAKKSEIHMMEHVDGVMKMRPMPNGAPVPAGGMLVLKPGGMHLMFMGIDEALAPGRMLSVTLQFEVAGDKTVMAHVKRPADLKALMDADHSDHSNHGDHAEHSEHDDHAGHGEHDDHDGHGDHKKKHDH